MIMLGLFGALNLGQRSLQTQRQGVEVAGHNLANVNQPGYTRQRLVVQSSTPLETAIGPQGTGADATAIQQVRSAMVDQQMQIEMSVRTSLETQQQALQQAQADLGQQIDRAGTTSTTNTAADGQSGLSDSLSSLFSGFQALATQPASSDARQNLINQAQDLAGRFNQIDQRLGQLRQSLNQSIQTDTDSANQLLKDIADLNAQIADAEFGASGAANDLRDSRQAKVEALSKLVKVDTAEEGGMLQVSVGGASLVSGREVVDKLQAVAAGDGQYQVQVESSSTPLTLSGGSLQGAIEARDGGVAQLQQRLDTLVSSLIDATNRIHASGYSFTGSSGAAFFTGTNAATIQVNVALRDNPALIQASGDSGARSDNRVALALAQMGNQNQAALGDQTFSQYFGQTVAGLGNALNTVNQQLSDQQLVESWLTRQRDAVSGVSLDEEMTELVKYQKAFEASARLINTVDEMLDVVINLKQ